MTESELQTGRRELERVLASPGFVRNDRLARFLRFVVEKHLEGRDDEVKESVLAVEVFGRSPDHNSRQDSIVRTEASRLRARLSEYYLAEGKDDPVTIELPRGGYTPVFRHLEQNAPQPSHPRRLWLMLAAALLLAAAAASVALWQAGRPRAKPTVAVLPFVNLSSDPEGAYFGDGLADEITGLLSRTEGLEVIARTSAFALRDARLDAREIGARLNATVLVEGSVRKAPDRLKVIVQLIRAADGKHLWANTYEGAMQDVFVTEEEIAASIVNALRLKLDGRRRYTDNPQAFELYLRGRYAYDHASGSCACGKGEPECGRRCTFSRKQPPAMRVMRRRTPGLRIRS